MEDLVTEKLKARIRERMEMLGLNPSSVALEANLSRSAVRDILSGKARNPGIVTIHAISDVLQCSYSYLMGDTDTVQYAEATDILIDVVARTSDVSGTLEAGVFRQIPPDRDAPPSEWHPGYRERKPLRSKRRYLHRDLYLYRVGDNSLEGVQIAKGDLLTAVFDPSGVDAPSGKLVIVAHRLAGANVEELSARLVKRSSGGLTLSTAPADFGGPKYPDIHATELGEFGRYKTAEGGTLLIEGVVVEMTRQLDV